MRAWVRRSAVGCAMLLAAAQAVAAERGCDRCGRAASCRKICRAVCEVEQVPKVTYDTVCEEICIPGKSLRATACDDCGSKHHVYTPVCGQVRTRTRLVKHETVEERLTYRWIVETLCCDCAQQHTRVEPLPTGGLRQPMLDARRTHKPLWGHR